MAPSSTSSDVQQCENLRNGYKRACHADIEENEEYGAGATIKEVGSSLLGKVERLKSRWTETLSEIQTAMQRGGGDFAQFLEDDEGDRFEDLSASDDVEMLSDPTRNPFAALQAGLNNSMSGAGTPGGSVPVAAEAAPSSVEVNVLSTTALLKWFHELRKRFLSDGGSLLKKQGRCLELRRDFFSPKRNCPAVLGIDQHFGGRELGVVGSAPRPIEFDGHIRWFILIVSIATAHPQTYRHTHSIGDRGCTQHDAHGIVSPNNYTGGL